jgi:hypothetical protein
MDSEGRGDLNIPAVRDNDLRKILAELGMLNQFENFQFQCHSCGKPIGWHNFGAFVVKESRLLPFCDSLDCLNEASRGRT